MQDRGPSSCPLAAFSQKATESSGWSHAAPLKLTNLLHGCLNISFSKVILCQLFGKAWCGLNIFFSPLALLPHNAGNCSGGSDGRGWEVGQPRCISEVWKCVSRKTLSVRPAIGRTVLTYSLWGSKPWRSSNRAVFETLDPAGIMWWFYLTCEHLWQGIRSLVLCLLL